VDTVRVHRKEQPVTHSAANLRLHLPPYTESERLIAANTRTITNCGFPTTKDATHTHNPTIQAIELTSNDFLFGGGSGTHGHNKFFRNLITKNTSKYEAAKTIAERTAVILETISLIKNGKGRFLKKLNIGKRNYHFAVVDNEETIIAKMKHAFYYSLVEKQRARKIEAHRLSGLQRSIRNDHSALVHLLLLDELALAALAQNEKGGLMAIQRQRALVLQLEKALMVQESPSLG
jgi:hypothetical protein